MKVLLYGLNYAPEPTGVGKYTGEMGEWLAARGHEVRVVTAPPYYPAWRTAEGYSSARYKREKVADVNIWRCPLWVPKEPISGFARLLHLASFVLSSLPVMLWLTRWRPDLVAVVAPSLLCAPSAGFVARLSGAKLWLHMQDLELDAATGLDMFRSTVAKKAMYVVERALLKRPARVSTITETMRLRVARKGIDADSTRLLPNWSDNRFVRPLPRDNAVRRQFGATPEDLLVLYAGNIGEKQGLELVLDAADRLAGRSRIKFVLVGDGAARKRLEQSSERRGLKNVSFFPLQPVELLPQMLAAGDIHLVVQRREAADLVMPSKLTNILAAGRPAVATAEVDTALHDVLNEHVCGITTPPGDPEGLVEALVKLAGDPHMRELMGRNARRYAEAYLDKEKILARFEGELLELKEEAG